MKNKLLVICTILLAFSLAPVPALISFVAAAAFSSDPSPSGTVETNDTNSTCGTLSVIQSANIGSAFPTKLDVGDFNNDLAADLVITNSPWNGVAPGVSVAVGNGGGGIATTSYFELPTSAIAIAVGEFNSDGKQDLAIAGCHDDEH